MTEKPSEWWEEKLEWMMKEAGFDEKPIPPATKPMLKAIVDFFISSAISRHNEKVRDAIKTMKVKLPSNWSTTWSYAEYVERKASNDLIDSVLNLDLLKK